MEVHSIKQIKERNAQNEFDKCIDYPDVVQWHRLPAIPGTAVYGT